MAQFAHTVAGSQQARADNDEGESTRSRHGESGQSVSSSLNGCHGLFTVRSTHPLPPSSESEAAVALVSGCRRFRVRHHTKLYAVRDSSGQFKDIQTYKRAHRADLAKTSKVETTAGKTARKKAARKTAKKR